MRFASVPLPKNVEPRSPAAEFMRKLLGEKAPAQQQAAGAVARHPEPPFYLDQRVRLVGEWLK